MLKLLVKKQLMEVFRMYFYDAKKNKKKPKGKIILGFVFFAVIMMGFVGGIFTGVSLGICEPLAAVKMDWLYYVLMGIIAILFGAFGSVFNTFSGLYLSKDNDLLLSMPIPLKYIIGSRLINVYLLGGMYSIVVILPALIVYWIKVGITAANVIGGLVLILVITAFVLILSCLLGWCVAKISMKIKSKSLVTVLISLVCIGLYFLICGKAEDLIATLVENAAVYGTGIKAKAYAVYLFGMIGKGDVKACAVYLIACAILMIFTWRLLKNTFMGIASSGSTTSKTVKRKSGAKSRPVFKALLAKEFGKFLSSPNYMLNCGLGIILIPLCGILLLIKSEFVNEAIGMVFEGRPEAIYIVMIGSLCALAATNDMVAPSVSLEGKSIWIMQSLPVDAKTVLRAKLLMHIILTAIPMAFAALCMLIVLDVQTALGAIILVMPLIYVCFMALLASCLGILMPNLAWTNETVPIKQSGPVIISLFGGWAVSAIVIGIYFLTGCRMDTEIYLALWSLIFAGASVYLLRWLDTKGAQRFRELQ